MASQDIVKLRLIIFSWYMVPSTNTPYPTILGISPRLFMDAKLDLNPLRLEGKFVMYKGMPSLEEQMQKATPTVMQSYTTWMVKLDADK